MTVSAAQDSDAGIFSLAASCLILLVSISFSQSIWAAIILTDEFKYFTAKDRIVSLSSAY